MTATTSARRLENKTAVIFGAAGEVGSAVANELAAQGAQVFLSGRTKARVQQLAQTISSRGETATAAEASSSRRWGDHRRSTVSSAWTAV